MKKMQLVFSFFLMLLFAQGLLAQTTVVSGTVNASDGVPLPGASIIVKGTAIGGVSDFDGNFSLSIPDATATTLVVSYIGYKSKEVALKGLNQNLIIVLTEDANSLDEVVIVGSSVSQSRKKLGNAITTVKSVALVKAAPINITSSLQGKVPGAQITQNSGDPSGGFSIRLRGPSTIKGSSEPLYVIDGVITSNLTTNVTNLNVSAGDAQPGQNRMVDINPNDIENINILNGAAAAAI